MAGVGLAVLASSAWAAHAQPSPPESSPIADTAIPATWDAWQTATLVPDGPARFWDVTRWSRGFAAIGADPHERRWRIYQDPVVWLSHDGSRWVRSGPLADGGSDRLLGRGRSPEVWRLARHGSGLLGIGTDERRLAVWRSNDGRRWQRIRHQPAFEPAGVPIEDDYSLGIGSVVTGHGRVVVSGDYSAPGDTTSYSRTWVTEDGDSWRRAEPRLRYPASMSQVAVAPDGFLGLTWARHGAEGCGFDEAKRIVRSADGLAWSDIPGSAPICRATSLTLDQRSGAFYVLTTSGESARMSVLRSTDLRRWEEVYRGPTEIGGRAVDMGGGVITSTARSIAVVGTGSYRVGDDWLNFPWALTSRGGRAWSLSTGWPGRSGDLDITASAMDRDRIVAVDVHGDGGAWFADARATLMEGTVTVTGRPWGPLAVTSDGAQQDLDATLGPGRLLVGEDCVTPTMAATGETVTLVWRDSQTSWDPSARRITFADRDEGTMRLADGDRMLLSGAPITPMDDADEGAADPTWIAPPHDSCPASRWVVDRVDPRPSR